MNINIEELLSLTNNELYNRLATIGVSNLTSTVLDEIAKQKFRLSLVGNNKKRKFDRLMNEIYQRDYYDAFNRKMIKNKVEEV